MAADKLDMIKNIFLYAFGLLASISFAQADVCHTQKVSTGEKSLEFFRIEDTPEARINAKPKMLVSGIYQFVPKKVLTSDSTKESSLWSVYRCAKEGSLPPVYDPNNCQPKNDFQYGSFVAKNVKGSNLQKVSLRGNGTLGVTMPSATDLPEYHVEFRSNEISVKEIFANTSFGDAKKVVSCEYASGTGQGAASRSGTAPAKVKTSN